MNIISTLNSVLKCFCLFDTVLLLIDKQLTISVRDFFAAGTETTSTAIRWAILFLIIYPEWQKKLRENIDVEIGQMNP